MKLRGISIALCAVAVFISGCGGGGASHSPPLQAQAPQAAIVLDGPGFMDWAEHRFPAFFPGHSQNRLADTLVFRAYALPSGGWNYLAVLGGSDIFVLGEITGERVVRLGALSDFTCAVYPQNCAAAVSGTAAAGAPIAGVTVTLKDSASNTVTATTSITGAYTLNTSGLTGPFLLQLTTSDGRRLYGVTADLDAATVANITPLTDLIVRSWYSVQGVPVDTAFANPGAAPPPTQPQTIAIAKTVLSVMQLALNNANAGVSAPLELITKPFSADHTGLDAVLDQTTITYGSGATLTVSGSGLQQTSVIGYDTATGAVTASSTTANTANTSTNAITAVVPVQTAQAAAQAEIAALLDNYASVINSRAAALGVADLTPFIDPNLFDNGLNREQYVTRDVAFYRGQTVGFAVQRIVNMDLGIGRAELLVRVTQNMGGQTSARNRTLHFQKVNGAWTLSGNDWIAFVEVFASAGTYQGAYTTGSGPEIKAAVLSVQGSVSNVTVTSGASAIAIIRGATIADNSGAWLDQFIGSTNSLTGAFPTAGTLYDVRITLSGGSNITYAMPLNAFTTEGVRITSPTGTALANASLDGTLNVSWTLPLTYAVADVMLSGVAYTGPAEDPASLECETAPAVLSATATSGTLNIPSTCSGRAVVRTDILLGVTGVNGEYSETHYRLEGN